MRISGIYHHSKQYSYIITSVILDEEITIPEKNTYPL